MFHRQQCERTVEMFDWIIKYITGAKGRLLKAPLLSIYLSLPAGKLWRQLRYLICCYSLSQLHNQWYFLVVLCFHCYVCNVCDQRSHIGRWVRMFIWSSDFFLKQKLWHLHCLDKFIPLAVRTIKPLRRGKVGLFLLTNDQNKKVHLFWEQNYSVPDRDHFS